MLSVDEANVNVENKLFFFFPPVCSILLRERCCRHLSALTLKATQWGIIKNEFPLNNKKKKTFIDRDVDFSFSSDVRTQAAPRRADLRRAHLATVHSR